MRVHFEYGWTRQLDAEIPAGLPVRTLAYKQSAPLPDPAASLREVLESPDGRAAAGGCGIRPKERVYRHLRYHLPPVPNEANLTARTADTRIAGHTTRTDPDPRRHRSPPAERRG